MTDEYMNMNIQGIHILFTLLGIAFAIYLLLIAIIGTMGWKEAKRLGIPLADSVGKRRRLHIAIVVIGALLVAFRPFKLDAQSDASRTAMRHSFDTPVYESDRPMTETSRFSYDLEAIRAEQNKAKEQWDSKHNQ